MNQVSVRREWSAITLGVVASIAACTTCAVAALIFMESVKLPDVTWTTTHKVIAMFFPYLQLVASTIWRAPVERQGDVITGMIYGECGDHSVRTTVRQWVVKWYISVLCFSAAIAAIGIGILSMKMPK